MLTQKFCLCYAAWLLRCHCNCLINIQSRGTKIQITVAGINHSCITNFFDNSGYQGKAPVKESMHFLNLIQLNHIKTHTVLQTGVLAGIAQTGPSPWHQTQHPWPHLKLTSDSKRVTHTAAEQNKIKITV